MEEVHMSWGEGTDVREADVRAAKVLYVNRGEGQMCGGQTSGGKSPTIVYHNTVLRQRR